MVFSVIALAIIIAIIVYCCRRCKRAAVGRVPYPVTPVYGVSPYAAQPVVGVGMVQPVLNVQPYGVNANYAHNPIPNVNLNYNQAINNQYAQYNLATPVQPESDMRMNQDFEYDTLRNQN